MVGNVIKNVFTIPSDACFIDKLAEGLWQQAGCNTLKLSEFLVLLPTRRACRHLREAFLRVTNKHALLLPRMQPLGDLDEEEFYFAENVNPDLPPAIAPLRRQLLLTQLIKGKDPDMPLDQAAQLAAALARFLDQVQIERRDWRALDKLVPENLAQHWQQTLEFLKILTVTWPQMLAAEGCLDPADRRNRVFEAQAAAWRARPPSFPVVAAGSTGSQPATAELLAIIADLPAGAVVLPGLDQELPEDAWQKIADTHPQFGMKEWLEKFGVKRKDILLWSACTQMPAARVRLLQESMRPAETSDGWRSLRAKDVPRAAVEGLTRLTLENPQEEAQAIALIMRAALETPKKTATLVTADRSLAERVAVQLARWNIEVNDSAGAALASQPIGGFLLDVLAAASPEATAIDYLSLLKHPFTACGLTSAECRARARQIEIAAWRGLRRADGLQGASAALRKKRGSEGLSDWLLQIAAWFKPFAQNARKKLPLGDRIAAHITLAEQLAASDTQKGDQRLWSGERGEKAAEWLDDWRNAAAGFPALDGADYASMFAGFLRGAITRPRFGQHPRLSILGPLEARLVQANLMILGGLNEDSWPPETEIDPWMSRVMKRNFGLSLPERRIGLSAHDFVQLASAPEMVLTRARRTGNAPAVPSRFLLQLETVLEALGYQDKHNDALAPKEPWQDWARRLDAPAHIKPCARPEPCPPLAARPTQLRVTEIGLWQRNPYAIYARHVLGLRPLDTIDADATAADRGIVIHQALERFLSKFPDQLPSNALEELLAIGRNAFADYKDWPQVGAFWWPRFERVAAWFIETERTRRAQGIKVLKVEAEGTLIVGGTFTIKGRADRIDRLADGTLAIIDYKTGGLPRQIEVRTGIEPQLPLLAAIASADGFGDVKVKAPVSSLAYWQLSGGGEPAHELVISASAATLAATARAGLENLITAFADPATPYQAAPKPRLMPRYDNYAHLARMAEWGRTEEI